MHGHDRAQRLRRRRAAAGHVGRPGLNLLNNGLWLALNFDLNLWLIEVWGALGAALGAAASMLLINLWRLGQLYVLESEDRALLERVRRRAAGGRG